MVTFLLVVTSDFWDTQRRWPAGCRPVIFSTDMVMKNTGTVQLPARFAHEAEQMLRAHPHVLTVERVPALFPRLTEGFTQRAA